jgi:hypothetical protein
MNSVLFLLLLLLLFRRYGLCLLESRWLRLSRGISRDRRRVESGLVGMLLGLLLSGMFHFVLFHGLLPEKLLRPVI